VDFSESLSFALLQLNSQGKTKMLKEDQKMIAKSLTCIRIKPTTNKMQKMQNNIYILGMIYCKITI